MDFAVFKNPSTLKLKDIPALRFDSLLSQAADSALMRPVAFFGDNFKNSSMVYLILADDQAQSLYAARASLKGIRQYQSLTQTAPQFHMLEREFYEETGILPSGHPWLKPLRYPANSAISPVMEDYPFYKITGDEIHEVAVGPVHAGVIEPGHFRFMCSGEMVHHLEIQLGYQHRGVEPMFAAQKSPQHFMPALAEAVCGDSTIANCFAYCQTVESLCKCTIQKQAGILRAIALEMERAAIHLGDLSALSNDVAYLMGNSVFGALRTLVINSLQDICGNRFGKSLIQPGGVNGSLEPEIKEKILVLLNKVKSEAALAGKMLLSSVTVSSRFEKTGVITKKLVQDAAFTGMVARSTGVDIDTRFNHPYGEYRSSVPKKALFSTGDVLARAELRVAEMLNSLEYAIMHLEKLPVNYPLTALNTPSADSLTVSMTEGWRGEIAWIALTGVEGQITRMKIKDPSTNNWYALALSVRNNGISDFPLCNKSFNLSYCGNDL